MNRRRLAGLLVALTMTATACGPLRSDPPSSDMATAMLASIVLPPGATEVPYLANSWLSQAAQSAACSPLIDKSRFWTVESTLNQVDAFLKLHPEKGRGTQTSATFSGPSSIAHYVAEGQIDGADGSTLVISFVNIGNNKVGIRADAQVVPVGARCVSSVGRRDL